MLNQFAKVLLQKQNNWFDRFPPCSSHSYQPECPYHQLEQRPITQQLRFSQPPQSQPSYGQTTYGKHYDMPNRYGQFPQFARPQPQPTAIPSTWNAAQCPGNIGNYPQGTIYPYQFLPHQPSTSGYGQQYLQNRLLPPTNQMQHPPLTITGPPKAPHPVNRLSPAPQFQCSSATLARDVQPPPQ